MGELLNLVGLSTGVVLYAMLLVMVVRAGRTPSAPSRFDSLLLATSLLGLVWNLCALPAYELPKVGIEGPFPFLVALGFSALGFLPAVVVHSVLRGERKTMAGAAKRAVAAVAYLVSGVASVLHAHAALTGAAVPSAVAMRLLTSTFVALVVPLAALTRRQPGSRRAVWAAALAVFAVSALHLSQLHPDDASWPVELLGHHASVPLAFAILYQDYPFALADLFLKRALTLVVLVTITFVAIATFGMQSAAFDQFRRVDPRQVGALVTMWVATALAYPALRRATSWFVDTVILRRPDYRSLRATISRRVQAQERIASLLTEVCELLTPAMSARTVSWHEVASEVGDDEGAPIVAVGEAALRVMHGVADRGASVEPEPRLSAAVLIPVAEAPRYALIVGALTGGRRLLSDDLATLESIAVLAARRIDVLRITRERYQRELREQEIAKLVSEAELRALRAQVNPHFLFNALTTLGYLIQTAPTRALDTLLRLTSLLRGVLRSEGEFATLGRELDLVESYLEIERARFEERLRVRIDVPSALRTIRVPVLLLQPIVENAVKHGVARQQQGGDVTIEGALERSGHGSLDLCLTVRDTGSGVTAADLRRGRALGVGLNNVERRLHGQYGSDAALSIQSVPGQGTTVTIRLPAEAWRTADRPVRRVG